MASSSSLPTGTWTYDVFLSFRGEDTRMNFVDHLYEALVQKGIYTFKDDALERGKMISSELVKAIEQSRFAVVVFSENYASSSWCLDELAKIMECRDMAGQTVLPVFYHVEPSDVRGLKRNFARAFQQYEEKFKGEEDKLNKWRDALTAASTLSGWHVSKAGNGGESKFINKIVEEILGGIQPQGMESNLIGMEYHIEALNSLLCLEATSEVRVIGIWGMGGIGKTTIAEAVFRRISYKFDGCSFVKDVREYGSSKRQISGLREQILRDTLVIHPMFRFQNLDQGANMMSTRFINKKVLLVLDDVDNVNQLEYLVATHEWFGPGSRIIITTRDEHLLAYAHFKYKPNCLLMDQAVELFSRHAFKKNCPPKGYEELSYRAVTYTGCLPLALKVLGSFFHGRQASVWESALNKLSKAPNVEIIETLRLSFNGLDDSEKKIFLDVACFFKDKDKEHVTRILDSFSFDAVIGVSVLIEKSLITVSNKKLGMHDLIQEMGWQIVCESFFQSRLWKAEEIHDAINRNGKCASVDHRLSIAVPGSKIPSWFKEERHGCNVTLRLPPKLHTQVLGFAICGVFHGNWDWKYVCPRIIFKIVNAEKVIPESVVDVVCAATDECNLWVTYIPFSFFKQMYQNFQPQDWSHIEGNLVMTVTRTDGYKSERCGAHVIYKEDVELVQQLTTCVSDYGNLVRVDGTENHEELSYERKVSANTYVYEEKSDEKDSKPTFQRHDVYNRSLAFVTYGSYAR